MLAIAVKHMNVNGNLEWHVKGKSGVYRNVGVNAKGVRILSQNGVTVECEARFEMSPHAANRPGWRTYDQMNPSARDAESESWNMPLMNRVEAGATEAAQGLRRYIAAMDNAARWSTNAIYQYGDAASWQIRAVGDRTGNWIA